MKQANTLRKGATMHQVNREHLDERINDFISRKTAPKNLSQLIADRLTIDQQSDVSGQNFGYELLPLRRRLSQSH